MTDQTPAGELDRLRSQLDALRTAARSAAALLRSVDANANTGRPQDVTAIRAAAAELDRVAS